MIRNDSLKNKGKTKK